MYKWNNLRKLCWTSSLMIVHSCIAGQGSSSFQDLDINMYGFIRDASSIG